MNRDEREALERKRKKKSDLLKLIFLIILFVGIGIGVTYLQKGSKKDEFKAIAQQTLKSLNDNYKTDNQLGEFTEDVTYTFPDKSIINFDERTLKGGTITQYTDGTVEFALYDNDYCAVKQRTSSNIEVTEYKEGECTVR